MESIINSVISKIEAQQKGIENTAAWCVGEQLKDMAQSDTNVAEILEKDLDVEAMSIKSAEKKIEEYANKNRKGKCGFVPPKEADRILREFYGLPGADDGATRTTEQVGSKVIDLTAFL